MDSDRRELERALAASPSDQGLARKLVLALVREGRASDALALYEAKYVCSASWESLGTGFERACPACGDVARLALDEREVLVRLAAARSVAIPRGSRSFVLETLLSDPRFHPAQERRAPRIHLDGSRSADSQRSGYRELFHAIEGYRGESLVDVVLEPRHAESRLGVFQHSALRRRAWAADPRSGARAPDDLWELYALLRVTDALLARALAEDGLDLPEFLAFFESLGFSKLASERAFSPLHHEIAAAEEHAHDRVVVAGERWPGLAWGDLVFLRAGVAVRAPRSLVDPGVALRSPLLFSYRRQGRACRDLSSDWGSNSQWRTELPRFYDERDVHLFNVDENHDLGSGQVADDPLEPSLDRQREILLHRSCVRAPEVSGEGADAETVLFRRMAIRADGDGPLWPLDPARVVALPPSSLPR